MAIDETAESENDAPDYDETPYFHGVYAIRNRLTGMMYVGCTRGLRARWQSHLWALRNGRHDAPSLQMAWERDGIANFELVLLELVELQEDRWATGRVLRDAEREWMLKLTDAGVALYNRSTPRPHITTVVGWNPETMLPRHAP